MNYKRKVRMINGRRRVVKVYKCADGSERVRVLGHRNTRDNVASKANRKRRVARYWNKADHKGRNYKR